VNGAGRLAPTVCKGRLQALLYTMKMNMSIRTIHLCDRYNQDELFRGTIIPYLVTNRLRPRLLEIQKTRPIPYRVKVLGRALLAARTDANTFWMLLAGNAEVAFPSRTTTTITAAAILSTSASAAVASTTHVTDIAASVMSASTATETGSPLIAVAPATSAATASTGSDALAFASTGAAAAANVATLSAVQKRKARP
jgi:hypothetical protein